MKIFRTSLFATAALMLGGPSVGLAASAAPHWAVLTQAAPSEFHPGDARDFYEVIAENDGGAATSGPITVTDSLPAGTVVDTMSSYSELPTEARQPFNGGCQQVSVGSVVTVTCTTETAVPVGQSAVLNINVGVPGSAVPGENLVNTAVVSGGGAPGATESKSATTVSASGLEVPFGAGLASDMTERTGLEDTQAGSHPFMYTTMIDFNAASIDTVGSCNEGSSVCASLNAQARDVEVRLPAGLVGDAQGIPRCPQAEFEEIGFAKCSPDTQVGSMYLYFYGSGTHVQYAPVYNLQPPPGQPAALGFSVSTVAHIPIFFHVRTGDDYGVTAVINEASEFDSVRMAVMSVWGFPSDEAHDPRRLGEAEGCKNGQGGCPSGVEHPKPFLRLPTSCPGLPLSVSIAGDSWQSPEAGAPFAELANASTEALGGCENLSFQPELALSAQPRKAGVQAGYTVTLKNPQNEEPEALGTPDIRDAEVKLPVGTVLSPSAANGLATCSEEAFGLRVNARGNCPSASRIGSVKITTPLLATPVMGNLYVGEPECGIGGICTPSDAENGKLLRVLLEAEADGVIVKQAGHAKVDQATGQVSTVFIDTPQLPFSELEVTLQAGANAPLVNPSSCGAAVAEANLTPWSSSVSNVRSEPFQVEGCGTEGFAPGFRAGTSPTHASAFAGFSMVLSHNDGEQTLGRVSVTTPPGLLGVLKYVERCGETQANAGTCGAGSQIGTGSAVVGPGNTPIAVPGSRVYLTGPYDGKPFGLSITTPAVAGPFTLSGNTGLGTEVIRASIAIDRHTGAITVTSDPLPQALDGVPLDIRSVEIDVNRQGFTFSPTNCNDLAVGATITSSTGTVYSTSYPFQATGCSALPFKPTFKVSTAGHASKASGASLHVKVTSAGGPQPGGGEANIAKVKVNLPLQLPSRLSTLQKACVDSVFEANPGSCPAASVVGQATAVTPLLAHPLTGPAYLVSHAGAAFPDLEIVLQGEGITLILDGNTQIKKGITSSIFRAVPDAPISSFDLVLPEGPHSVLATNLPAKAKHNLCGQTLNMPTVITGQNGAVVRQTTKIAITGCPTHKTKGKSKKR